MSIDPSIKTILFVGPTGSGKGTQAELLGKKLGFPVFSTGDRYREIRSSDTYLGDLIRKALDEGYLMPGWFSTFLFEEALLYRAPEDGIICEGVGRTLFEVQQFHEVMGWLKRPYIAFSLNLGEEESVRRQLARGRMDSDTEEKLHVRFKAFTEQTSPAIAYLRAEGQVIDIDAGRTIEEVHADVCKALGI